MKYVRVISLGGPPGKGISGAIVPLAFAGFDFAAVHRMLNVCIFRLWRDTWIGYNG